MAAGKQSYLGSPSTSGWGARPEITACRSGPERVVFLESGNTDGWIASDVTTEITQ